MNKRFENRCKPVIFKGTSQMVENVFSLPYVGAGHDGYVFRYGDLALKVLKYDISTRKSKDLMTFDKAMYFASNLNLTRFAAPQDILLDSDGVYCGYSMQFLEDLTSEKKKGTPRYRTTSSYSCGDLVTAIDEFRGDVDELNHHKVLIQDINKGSYVFTSDFMHFVDMDKFKRFLTSNVSVVDKNTSSLNYIIAKFLYQEMIKAQGNITPEQLTILNNWLKKSSNSKNFLSRVQSEIGTSYSTSIGEYATEKAKSVLK